MTSDDPDVVRESDSKSTAGTAPSTTGIGAVDVMLLVVWLGVLTGFAEVGILGVLKLGALALPPEGWGGLRHGYVWLSPHVVWMAPLAFVGILAVPGVVLGLLANRWPGRISFKVIVGGLVFVCGVGLLRVYPRLYDVAVLLLAGGVGVQVGRWAERHRAGFGQFVRRSTGWLTALVALTAVALVGGTAVAEQIRLRRLPPVGAVGAGGAGTPNVLLIIWDTVRASDMSVYGYGRRTTPRLEVLAREGVVFDRAYATSPWTLPSHVSAFTGRWPYEFSASWLTPYEGEYPTLAERLAAHGYVTGGFVANLVYGGYESGIDRGFVHYEDYRISLGELVVSTALGRKVANHGWLRRLVGYYDIIDRKDATEVTAAFLRWVDGVGRVRQGEAARPFFAFLNYLDAHEPYLPPPPYDAQFGSPTDRRNERHRHQFRITIHADRYSMSPGEVQAELDAYDGTIAYMDEQIGALLDGLREKGMLDNTIVIVTSDHGEQFGERDFFLHGNSLYMPVLHVPMMVWFGDRVPAGARVAAPVSIRDIPATVVSLAGLPEGSTFPGTSLERYWNGRTTDDDGILSEFTDIRGAPTLKSLIVGRYHYIWGENRREQLYDLLDDPREENNLVRPGNERLLNAMRRGLFPHVRYDRALWERLPSRRSDIQRGPRPVDPDTSR
jgi:arylsulfatase A-like enzyme